MADLTTILEIGITDVLGRTSATSAVFNSERLLFWEEHEVNPIILTGVKVLHAVFAGRGNVALLQNSENSTHSAGTHWQWLKNWWKNFIYYSRRSSTLWLQLPSWSWVIDLADSIATRLIDSGELEELQYVYEVVFELLLRLSCAEFGSKFKLAGSRALDSIGLISIKALENRNKHAEAKVISKRLEFIRRMLKGDNLLNIANENNSKGNQGHDQREESSMYPINFQLKGYSKGWLVTFTSFNDLLHPPCVLRNVYFKYVELYKCELIWFLTQCPFLESLILEHVHIHGDCKERAYLPLLKVFSINLLWKPMNEAQLKISTHSVTFIESLSFFYKCVQKKIWGLKDIQCLDLNLYKVCVNGRIRVEINPSDPSINYGLKNVDFGLKALLESINFTPKKLELNFMDVSVNYNAAFGDTITYLFLNCISFRGRIDEYVKDKIELSDWIRNNFPNVKAVIVKFGNGCTRMSLDIQNLPTKVIALKVTGTVFLTTTATTEEIEGKRQTLKRLMLKHIVFNSEKQRQYEIEFKSPFAQSRKLLPVNLNELSLYAHFANLQTLCIFNIDAYTSLMSLAINSLSRKLVQLELICITLIVSNDTDMTHNQPHVKYELLKHLVLRKVILKTEDAKQYQECLLSHFPNMETLEISINRQHPPILLPIDNLPLQLSAMKLANVNFGTLVDLNVNQSYLKYDAMKILVLNNVNLKSIENEFFTDLCKCLLQYLPNLETLIVSNQYVSQFFLDLNNLPQKLVRLVVSTIVVITDASNNHKTESQCNRVYTGLEYLSLRYATLKNSAEEHLTMGTELCKVLASHFPQLHTFSHHACVHNHQLPRKLESSCTQSPSDPETVQLGYENDSVLTPKVQLRNVHLHAVELPVIESQINQLFGDRCEKIFIEATSNSDETMDNRNPTLSLLRNLIKIQSVVLICVVSFNWEGVDETENKDIVEWISNADISRKSKNFCLQKITTRSSSTNAVWEGRCIDQHEFNLIRDEVFRVKI